jgi:hypothetical protein
MKTVVAIRAMQMLGTAYHLVSLSIPDLRIQDQSIASEWFPHTNFEHQRRDVIRDGDALTSHVGHLFSMRQRSAKR